MLYNAMVTDCMHQHIQSAQDFHVHWLVQGEIFLLQRPVLMDNTNPDDILIDCFQNHQSSNERDREQADSRVIQ